MAEVFPIGRYGSGSNPPGAAATPGDEMPFVRRSLDGKIDALFATSANDACEELPSDHPEVVAFMGAPAAGAEFSVLDADFIRVLEDVIDALIDKGVLRVTDLPHEAQRKLSARKGLRRRLNGALNLLPGQDVI